MALQIADQPEPVYDGSKPLPSVKIVFDNQLKNVPGKSTIGILVSFPPGSAFPSHRHGGASVTGYCISGTLLNKMNDEPMKIVPAGASFYEAPGCHHRLSNNASETEPAELLATLVVDTKVVEEGGYDALTVVDPEFMEPFLKRAKEQGII